MNLPDVLFLMVFQIRSVKYWLQSETPSFKGNGDTTDMKKAQRVLASPVFYHGPF